MRRQPLDDSWERHRAWTGWVAGCVCSLASAAATGLCTWLACIELAARAGKVATGMLAAQLAAGAKFGGAAARRDVGALALPSALARAGAAAAAQEHLDAGAEGEAAPRDDEGAEPHGEAEAAQAQPEAEAEAQDDEDDNDEDDGYAW